MYLDGIAYLSQRMEAIITQSVHVPVPKKFVFAGYEIAITTRSLAPRDRAS